MKRPLLFPCALCLVVGLLAGILLSAGQSAQPMSPVLANDPALLAPSAASQSGPERATGAAPAPAALDTTDNFPLLSSACAVTRLLQQQDYAALTGYIHPRRGVTFTPYSTVDPDSDLTFTAAQIRDLAKDQTEYTWGFEDGRGSPIKMTLAQYIQRYVFDKDYTRATQIGIDQVVTSGNALENISQAYPDCRFVDFCFPIDPLYDGLDWSSLKLVFQAEGARWYLVGIVHGEWTI